MWQFGQKDHEPGEGDDVGLDLGGVELEEGPVRPLLLGLLPLQDRVEQTSVRIYVCLQN